MCRRALLSDTKRSLSESSKEDEEDNKDEDNPLQKEHKRRMLSTMCDIPLENLNEDGEPAGIFSFGRKRNQVNQVPDIMNPFHHDVLRSLKIGGVELDAAAHRDVAKKALRKVPSAPTRILDAPDIVDDYYLNLIRYVRLYNGYYFAEAKSLTTLFLIFSWSKDNILAVALAQAVYLWNAGTGAIQHLVTVGEDGSSDYVTSVNWCAVPDQTHFIGVGTNSGKVMIYDGPECRLVRTMRGHRGRVSSLHWNTHILSSGARDSKIINHDVRVASHIVSVFRGHEQEVCGLRWNEDGTTLASGGNENYLCLWDANMSQSSSGGSSQHTPRLILKQHKAAVKALDWCPFHRGLLASGGGTADRCVKFWNTSSGALLNSIDTGSQVCSIVWSRHQRELCTSHGYSENQLILWKYPSMTKIKELKGHSNRVLNMEMSPDGASVVSAAADETLRFWNVFGNAKITGGSSLLGGSDLSFLTPIR